MNHLSSCFAACIMCAAFHCRALTVAEAKALPVGTNIEVGPLTISTTNDLTASGYAFCAQDASGGLTFYWNSSQIAAARDFIQSNSLRAGVRLTVTGVSASYAGLFEINSPVAESNDGWIANPTPASIDIVHMRDGAPLAETNESCLVLIEGITFQSPGTPFANAVNYTIYKNGTSGVVRIQDATDPLVGTMIPSGPCAIEGILSQYDSTDPRNGGYQLYPLVITPEVPQADPSADVTTNFGFGMVFGSAPRTLGLYVQNRGASNTLLVSAIEPADGMTDKFSFAPGILPLAILPQSNATIPVTYAGGSPGDQDSALFNFLSNDSLNPTNPISFWGGVCAYDLTNVWINEIDYDTPGSYAIEQNEFVELCGPAGLGIAGWRIEFWYSPSPGVYSNYATHVVGSQVPGFTFLDETNGFGFYVLAEWTTAGPQFWDEKAVFNEMRNNALAGVRLVDASGQQVHFLEYGSYYARQYPYPWPDDITDVADTGDAETSLSLLINGFARTNMRWMAMGYTPGTPNVPWSNGPASGVAASLVEDTYVQQSYASSYEGGVAYMSVQPDAATTYAARAWLKFDLAPVKAGFDAMYGTGSWTVTGGTLDLRETGLFWAAAGQVDVYHMPDTGWSEGPTNPPFGSASGTMMCWNTEPTYTNGAELLGSFSSKGGNADNRCSLAASDGLAARAATGGMAAVRLFAPSGAAAAFCTMNHPGSPTVRPVLHIDAIPEPAAAGLLAVMAVVGRRMRGRITRKRHHMPRKHVSGPFRMFHSHSLQRTCLRCERPFSAHGRFNRLCRHCLHMMPRGLEVHNMIFPWR